MKIHDYIAKSRNNEPFSREELIRMLSFPPESAENYQIMAEAQRISRELTYGQAEIHAQFALNLSPCPQNCKFCSFARINGVFDTEVQIEIEEAVRQVRQFEKDKPGAIFVMTTANYDFGKFLEISQEMRKNIDPATILVANIGDKNKDEARKIKEAGYQGVYHAVRLREGKDTSIDPALRLRSINAFQEAGLGVGMCVEPIGPEHTNEEIAEMILLTDRLNPVFSGAMRRIPIPGSSLSTFGMISELRMAQIVAVTRLGTSRTVKGNCTHEPCTLGALAGANLFWAEVGANPRDTREKTEQGRGRTIEQCKTIFREANWKVSEDESIFFGPY